MIKRLFGPESWQRLIDSLPIGLLGAALIGAVVGAVATNFFWRRQRHADLCLDSLRRLHETAADILKEMLGCTQDAYTVSDELKEEWGAAATEIEDLLLGEDCDTLNELTDSITLAEWYVNDAAANEFSDMRRIAFRQLYATLGIIPLRLRMKQKAKFYFHQSTSWLPWLRSWVGRGKS